MIAFIHIKKTAGKTIKYIMQRELGITHCDAKRWHPNDDCYSAADLKRLRRIYPWLQSIAGHSIKAYGDLRQANPDIKLYTFLRDPIRRMVSQYQYELNLGRYVGDSFEHWVTNPANHDLQVKSLAGTANLAKALRLLETEVAFVGLMERLDESLQMMRPALGLPKRVNLSPARVNAARDNTLRDQILADPQRMALLQQANQRDQVLYDFARDQIFARQRACFEPCMQPAFRPKKGRSRRSYSNGAYRYAVYKPLVWGYRYAAASSQPKASEAADVTR